jgi:Protein of unknown function (DUF1360)
VEVATPSLTDPTAGHAAPEEERPLKQYALLVGLFQALVALAAVGLRRSGRTLPEKFSASDLILTGAATHKLSRLIAKDKVTSFARAPFTEYEGKGRPGELEEKPRGSGLRHTIGELLVCPFCLGLWISTAFGLGLVLAPRVTRLTGFILTTLGISDFLQIAYKAAEERASSRVREPL